MLQNLRAHIQGWVAGLIASVLCLAFALWGVEYYIGNTTNKVVVAKVNGESINKDQWDTAYAHALQSQQMPTDLALSEIFQAQLRQQVLQGLIQQTVLRKAAEKAGYVISPAQVWTLLQRMSAFQVNGQFSYPLFLRKLDNLSYTLPVFLTEMTHSSLLQQAQQSILDSNFVLPDDRKQRELLDHQKRDFGYFLISPSLFLNKTSLTESQIQDYYTANSTRFMRPEQVRIQYILLSTDDIAKKVTLNDNILRQEKIQELTTQASDQLSNLTYTHPDTLQPAASALGLSIQTTPFFDRSGHQMLVISAAPNNKQLSSKRAALPPPVTTQSKLIDTQQLAQDNKTQALLADLLENPKILSAAFSDNVLKQRNNSDVISIDDHTILVLRVLDDKAPAPKALAEVRKTIIEPQLKQQAADKWVTDLGQKIFQKIQKGESIPVLAKQNKMIWIKKTNIARTDADKQMPKELLNFVFNQPVPSRGKNVIRAEKLTDGAYVIVAISQVSTELPKTQDAVQRELVANQMKYDFGQLDADLYLAQHMAQAKIQLSASRTVGREAVGG